LQGYRDPTLQTTTVSTNNQGLYVPLFGVCGTIMQPVSYTLSGDEDPLIFQLSTFELGKRQNLHILANDTMQSLAPLASSSPDAGIKSARCFQHNFLKLLMQQQQYTELDLFLRYELYKSTAIKFKADAWNPCIVYAIPHVPCRPLPALCSCRDINSKPLVLCNRDRHFNFWVVVSRGP
jgi:hypothetical protein